jgi:carbamoyl-phosphate synthase small subunit
LDVESWQPHVAGFVVRELSPVVSSWRAEGSLAEYLEKYGIPGLDGVDTRALTKKLRVRGALNGFISTLDVSPEEAVARARSWPGLAGVDYVQCVTHAHPFLWDESDGQSGIFTLPRGSDNTPADAALPPADIPIVAFDYGMKYNILRRLRQHGFKTQVLPATATAREALACKPAGIFLSNGPGDPSALDYAVRTVAELIESGTPIFGICLGHQILGQAFGGRTFKLKFGHRGGNQPVKDLLNDEVLITAHNHGYAVDGATLPDHLEATMVNLNDGTNEGFRHRTLPIAAVQFHPEASPGPFDARGLFRGWLDSLR